MSFHVHLASVVLVIGMTAAASAAPAMPDRSPIRAARTADAAQVRSAAATEIDDEPANCSKARKRLWIEGEGWVVRKVTTCH